MVNILSYKENANTNYTKILSYSSKIDNKQTTMLVGREEPSYAVGGNVN
jgi:hypothetical protein